MAEFLDRLIQYNNESNEYQYNWDEIIKVPEFFKLTECNQSKKWHSEGTAWEHTKLVCEVMQEFVIKTNRFDCLSHCDFVNNDTPTGRKYRIRLLMTAALFHDIGKGVSTFEKNGEYHSYNHEFTGERLTRLLLWDEGWEFREAVCALVRYHMEVLRLFDGKDPYLKILTLSKKVNMNALICLKYADCFGSIPENPGSHNIDELKLSELASVCNALGCMWEPSTVVTNGKYKWNKYNSKKILSDAYLTVLIGLPGAGKDTFIKNYTDDKNIVVLCRDDIRAELGYCNHGDKIIGTAQQETEVSRVFDERIKIAAESGKHIIVNNMNTRAKYRAEYKNILSDYNLYVHYIYIENCKLADLYDRRKNQIPAECYKDMIMKFDWPMPDEYDKFSVNSIL